MENYQQRQAEITQEIKRTNNEYNAKLAELNRAKTLDAMNLNEKYRKEERRLSEERDAKVAALVAKKGELKAAEKRESRKRWEQWQREKLELIKELEARGISTDDIP